MERGAFTFSKGSAAIAVHRIESIRANALAEHRSSVRAYAKSTPPRTAHLRASGKRSSLIASSTRTRVEPARSSSPVSAPTGAAVVARLPAAASAALVDPQALAAQLDAWYGAPTRHYHGLGHLLAFLRSWADAMDSRVPGAHDDPVTFAAALLLHDAIYDVRRTDNEAASAALARTVLPRHIPTADVHQVEAMIVATGTHAFARPDADALPDAMALFLDCDLAALGADPATYVAYAHGVAAEYIPVVGRWRYRFGRSRFLKQLVRRPRLYHTAHFHAVRDAAARRHLAAEVRAWKRGATLDTIDVLLREELGVTA